MCGGLPCVSNVSRKNSANGKSRTSQLTHWAFRSIDSLGPFLQSTQHSGRLKRCCRPDAAQWCADNAYVVLGAGVEKKKKMNASILKRYTDLLGRKWLHRAWCRRCCIMHSRTMTTYEAMHHIFQEIDQAMMLNECSMSFRGNVQEALVGYCHERSINVSGGYHAGRQAKPKRASSSSERKR